MKKTFIAFLTLASISVFISDSSFAQALMTVGSKLTAKVKLHNTKKDNTVYILKNGMLSSGYSYVRIPDDFTGWIMGFPSDVQPGDAWFIKSIIVNGKQTSVLLTSSRVQGGMILESNDVSVAELEPIFEIETLN